MSNHFKKNSIFYLVSVLIFSFFTFWWIFLKLQDLDASRNARQLWGATYQILSLYGGIIGLIISQKWGGIRSLVGKVIFAFSSGLLLQVIGQSYSSFYVFHYHVESPPYPAVGDIGFFGSVVSYIYAVIQLSRVSGFRSKIKKAGNKVIIIAVPLIILISTYGYFLSGYSFDWTSKVLILLDFGYPLGQAFYVSIAILVLIMSQKILGGVMRKPILFLTLGLIFQYFSDVYFLYEAHKGAWYVGNVNDYLYCISYFIMTLAIISMGKSFNEIQESQ